MTTSILTRKREQGIALFVALMILIIVSMLGISAMRMSIFNAKIATSTQAGTLAFRGAESGISAVLREAFNESAAADPAHIITKAMTRYGTAGVKEIQYRCVTQGDVNEKSKCGVNDWLDSRELVKAGSRTVITGKPRLVSGGQVSTAGGGVPIRVWYDFVTVSSGSVPAIGVENFNAQEFSKQAYLSAGQL